MKDNSSFVQQCLDILKREDIKNEFKMLLKPVMDFIWYEINPYIYITVALVFLVFIMILAILILMILMIRNTHFTNKASWTFCAEEFLGEVDTKNYIFYSHECI